MFRWSHCGLTRPPRLGVQLAPGTLKKTESDLNPARTNQSKKTTHRPEETSYAFHRG